MKSSPYTGPRYDEEPPDFWWDRYDDAEPEEDEGPEYDSDAAL